MAWTFHSGRRRFIDMINAAGSAHLKALGVPERNVDMAIAQTASDNKRRRFIVGLGNPGRQYNFTRHNFGFLLVDFIAKSYDLEWKKERKFKAEIAILPAGTTRSAKNTKTDFILVKPQTFYNNSGETIQKLVQFYKIDVKKDLLVVCDDLNLDFGDTRLREQGSDGGNKGLKSVISVIGTDFPRYRFGTNNEDRAKIGDVDFVLGKFSPDEKEELPILLMEITAYLVGWRE